MTCTCHHVTEQTVHHPLLDGKVDDCLIIAVIDAGELRLLGLLLHDLDLIDDLRGNILGRKLRIGKEESLAVDRYLTDGLSVRRHRTVLGHLHARELLKKILQHIVVGGLE